MFNKSTFFNRENRNEDKKRTLNHVKKDLIVIPYIKGISDRATSTFNKSSTLVGCRTINKFNKFVKVQKDNESCTDHIIYRIDCKNCDASYMGQIKRKL